jgi:hypothetical protein
MLVVEYLDYIFETIEKCTLEFNTWRLFIHSPIVLISNVDETVVGGDFKNKILKTFFETPLFRTLNLDFMTIEKFTFE